MFETTNHKKDDFEGGVWNWLEHMKIFRWCEILFQMFFEDEFGVYLTEKMMFHRRNIPLKTN